MKIKTLSEVVTKPKKIVEEQSLQDGELIKLSIRKIKKNYFGDLKRIGTYNRNEDRMKDRF